MERPDVHHASPDTAADLIEDASAYQVGDDPTRSVFRYFEEIFHALHRHLGCRVMDDVIDHRSEHFCAASLVAPVNAHSLVGRKRSTTSTLFTIARTYTNATWCLSMHREQTCRQDVTIGAPTEAEQR